jgi:hypothetical protein
MNIALAPFIVEGILIIAGAVFGFLLEKKGKPYGKVKLVFHLFFFLWLSVGYSYILAGTIKAMSPTLIPVIVMGVALLCQVIVGISMLAGKEAGKTLPTIHKVSAIVMVFADICGLIIVAVR